jgi:anthranilate phosphoribosyltransferase
VLLNAAGALAAEAGDFRPALGEARESYNSGAALRKLDALIEFSQSVSQAKAA